MGTAVELFLKAGRCEEKGKMVKAVRLYRRAFKLCPELEEVRTQRELRLEERVVEESIAREEERVVTDTTVLRRSKEISSAVSESHAHSDALVVPSWAAAFHHSPCLPLVQVPEGKAHISLLPNEVLVNVLSFCTATPHTLDAVSAVCRAWFSVAREPSLWRAVCSQRWEGDLEELEGHVEGELEGDWRRCYIERPRPRYDGLYVSTNKYVRHGQQEGIYYDPIHEVHYWRLLRFYPDGDVLSLCTVEKKSAKRMHIQLARQQHAQARAARPNHRDRDNVVQGQTQQQQLEKVEIGTFELVGSAMEAQLLISTRPASGAHLNTLTGAIHSSRNGWLDRIRIVSYTRRHTVSGTESTFEPQSVAVFKFVRLPPEFLQYEPEQQ